VTIKNTGSAPFFLNSVLSSNPAEFAPGASTCPANGLAPTLSCSIPIGFTPAATGARSATLTLTDNAGTGTQNVALSGTGTVTMTVGPTSFAIPNEKFGVKVVKTVTIANKQSITVSLGHSVSGNNAADFTIGGGTCGGTLAGKTSCTKQVTFTPGALGSETATATFSDSPDSLSPYDVAFTVAGTIPETVSPISLSYGTVSRSSSKLGKTTVTNKSPFTISIGSSLSGANAGDFTITGGTCGSSLVGNSSCTIGVTFKPTTTSSESATLSVAIPQDPTSPHLVQLTGTGS
jgi:hypothetical protein